MKIEKEKKDGIQLIHIEESVDASQADVLTKELEGIISESNNKLVMDLAKVPYISSAGLRSILAALKLARTGGGDVRIAAANKDVTKIMEIAGMTSLVRTFGSVEDAIKSFE